MDLPGLFFTQGTMGSLRKKQALLQIICFDHNRNIRGNNSPCWESALTTSSRTQWPWTSGIRKTIWKRTQNRTFKMTKTLNNWIPKKKTKYHKRIIWKGDGWVGEQSTFSSLPLSPLPCPLLFLLPVLLFNHHKCGRRAKNPILAY